MIPRMRRLSRWPVNLAAALSAVLLATHSPGLPAHAAAAEPRPAKAEPVVGVGAYCAFGASGVSVCRGHVLIGIHWVTDRSRFPYSEARLRLIFMSLPPEDAEDLIAKYADLTGERCFDFAGIVVGYDHVRGMGHRSIGIVLPGRWVRVVAGGLVGNL